MKKEIALYTTGLINTRKNRIEVRNHHILLIQLAPLGDAATLIPSCLNLESKGYKLSFICQKGLKPLWKKFFPESVIVENMKTNWSSSEIKIQFQSLLVLEYEAVFVTSMKPYGAYLASFFKTFKRYGMVESNKFYKGSKLIFDSLANVGKREHVTDRFEKLFRLHVSTFSNKTDNRFIKRSGDFILIHPGGKWKPRRWPAERYHQVAAEFAKQGLQVRVVIHSSEIDLLEYFKQNADGQNYKIELTETIEDLIKAIESCSLFIGNDSGPGHLANIYGKESIILWGPGNYERIHPKGQNNLVLIKEVKCRPCKQYIHPEQCQRGENVCLLRTEVSEVIDNAFIKLRSVSPGK